MLFETVNLGVMTSEFGIKKNLPYLFRNENYVYLKHDGSKIILMLNNRIRLFNIRIIYRIRLNRTSNNVFVGFNLGLSGQFHFTEIK